MAGTFTKLYYHLVFSTKDRERHLTIDIQEELYRYIAGVIKGEEGFLISIGGMEDHVHILCTIPAKISVSNMLKHIKGNSSSWLHERFPNVSFHKWQSGFGAFSVSQSQIDKVKEYIQNQKEHHKEFDFKDEFRNLLKRHGISFDEKYIWL